MDVRTVTEVLIDGFLLGSYFVYCGCKGFDNRLEKTFTNALLILGLIAFSVVNYLFLDNIAKVVTLYVVVLVIYRFLFKRNIAQCAILSLISYLLLVIGEILFTLSLTGLHAVGLVSSMKAYTGSIIANFTVCLVALIIFSLISNFLRKMLLKVKENNKFSLIFSFISVMIAIISLLYKMYFNNWKVDNSFFLNIIIILCLVYIGLIVIKQHIDKSKINNDYEEYVEYSKESENLVEKYSISQHENKNELIIIRSMVHKSNKKLLEYLDEIISSKDSIENSWIKHLKYLPFGGLKGIFHNKINVMKQQGINVFLNISKEVGKSQLKDLTMKENNLLSKIMGVFLDNAKEAAVLSDSREVSICVYMDENKVIFEISNTYRELVNIDKLYKLGYSNKGKNRGYGLSLVKNIIDENNIFENETKAEKDYFVQILKLNK